VAVPSATLGKLLPTFTYIHLPPVRWTGFDGGGSVEWRANASGQDGTPGDGFDELKNAINAWDGAPGTNINYHYAGTTNNSNGLKNVPDRGDSAHTVS